MVSSKDLDAVISSAHVDTPRDNTETGDDIGRKNVWWNRCQRTYWGSLAFNFLTFLLPALYSTLSKLWVANIDSSQVVTTDVYTYLSVVAQILNDGLPRTAWLIIGDDSTRTPASRIGLSYTLVVFQALMGFIMTVIFVAAAESFAASFVPIDVRQASLNYVRISAPVALSSAIQVAVSSCTRALDQPDVPLLINSTGFVVNIILDLCFISKFHVGTFKPTILTQAGIRLACDMISAIAGLCYFVYISTKMQHCMCGSEEPDAVGSQFKLKTPGTPCVSKIIALGQDYATAWGVFNTIRWGLIIVPVQALEASTLTWIGHCWGRWRSEVGVSRVNPTASWSDIKIIIRPAIISSMIALAVEIPVCIFLSLWGMKEFAFYISNSESVAAITRNMWRNIDWCYIFYAVNYQLTAILLATVPRWFLYQALGSNFLWMLPWAIVVTKLNIVQADAWTFYSIIFGGALVFDFFNVGLVVLLWIWRLMKGKIELPTVSPSI